MKAEELSLEAKKAIREAVSVLRKGGIILYPTDTIWGIGCDATNEEAVERIFKIKHRPSSKAMLLLVDSDAKLNGLVREVPSIAYDLIDVAIHPLTLIYPGARNIALALIAEDGSVGIRITKEPFSHALCKAAGVPLVSTSANISGAPTAGCFAEISEEILQAVDYVVPVRQDEPAGAHASEILAVGVDGSIKVIRKA